MTGHHLLHQTPRRAETTKRMRETEAEAVASVVCIAIGLEVTRAASEYIFLYNSDEALLAESLTPIQRASTEITSGITPTGESPVR